MKISDFKGDEALELMADLIEPASTIINDPKTKELKADKPQLAKHILKNHKEEAKTVYKLLYKKDGNEANPIDLLQMIMDVLTDKDLLNLFTEQGQSMEDTRSGSAMESTEDGGR